MTRIDLGFNRPLPIATHYEEYAHQRTGVDLSEAPARKIKKGVHLRECEAIVERGDFGRVSPSSRFPKTTNTGIRVPRKTQEPLTLRATVQPLRIVTNARP
jgi:hypothetical protein